MVSFKKRTSPTQHILSVFHAMVDALLAVADRHEQIAENINTKAAKRTDLVNRLIARLDKARHEHMATLHAQKSAALAEADDARAAADRINQFLKG